MKGKINLKFALLGAVLSVMLLAPALSQAKEGKAEQFKKARLQMIKQLKLSPDKEKAVLAVEDKYAAQRKEIIPGLKKDKEALQAALAVPKPDEAKVQGLVAALTGNMDKLFSSFKSQRDEELALMTPVEQGKYLMAMMQWREKMMGKRKKK